jgi:D-ornithine---citrate ligase
LSAITLLPTRVNSRPARDNANHYHLSLKADALFDADFLVHKEPDMTQTHTEKQQQLLTRWNEAAATKAFSDNHLSIDYFTQALPIARQRSFQRLIQALFREGLLDATACVFEDGAAGCWLPLNNGSRLRFDHLSSGRMNSWQLDGRICVHGTERAPYPVEFPSELLQLLGASLNPPALPETIARLAMELDDSFINDTLCLAFHAGWTDRLRQQMEGSHAINLLAWLQSSPNVANPTLLLEQWGTLGHPWHPNYKTKLGLNTQQLIDFSPEFEASFPVVLCALHHDYTHVESMVGTATQWAWWHCYFPQSAAQLIEELSRRGLDANDYLPLPVHPWQREEHLPQFFANEIGDKLLILTDVVAFHGHPTMSFRTVVPEASNSASMIKLPVALRLTSVQRTVSPRSARMGPRVSELLLNILEQEPELQRRVSIVPERIGVHYCPQPADDERSRHLAALYRDNPLSLLMPGELAIPVGSLFAHGSHNQPLLRQWVQLSKGSDDAAAMRAFFADYLAIAVPGLLGMYLLYGVAFEAHQQNSFMVKSPEGQPHRLLLRDFGDIRIDRDTLRARGLDIELHDPKMTLYDDARFVRDKLLHTTFMCHLGELTLLCSRHWDVAQDLLWDELAKHVSQCFEALRERVEPQRWRTERQALLEDDWPAKSFMRMRLQDCHADIVGRLSNPLRATADER